MKSFESYEMDFFPCSDSCGALSEKMKNLLAAGWEPWNRDGLSARVNGDFQYGCRVFFKRELPDPNEADTRKTLETYEAFLREAARAAQNAATSTKEDREYWASMFNAENYHRIADYFKAKLK